MVLRITSCRCVLLDEDNLAGGCKYLIDAIRRSGQIPDDDPGSIQLIIDQVQVRTKREQGTLVRIERAARVETAGFTTEDTEDTESKL